MDLIPLRDLLDAQHRQLTERLDKQDERLIRIEAKLDGHKHPGLVAWQALVPILLTTAGLLFAVLR